MDTPTGHELNVDQIAYWNGAAASSSRQMRSSGGKSSRTSFQMMGAAMFP